MSSLKPQKLFTQYRVLSFLFNHLPSIRFLLPLSKQKDDTSKHKQSSSGISKWIHSR
ncbi:Uncharacterized protein APZ42_022719 [Daphnia magna]|uniref:Uncharacterized protein n=1 Tax=Daphnia magna TaxID=35525 RepID=A0A164VQV8_9CRUS|nr:Uncharacterized protein APZ42_022719 [Daphnia magna]